VTQYNGRTRLRRVLVLVIDGAVATVQALNGPLRGSVYDTALANLRG
jgi:hypothetical protein